jgi:hypothetical protein
VKQFQQWHLLYITYFHDSEIDVNPAIEEKITKNNPNAVADFKSYFIKPTKIGVNKIDPPTPILIATIPMKNPIISSINLL